MMSKKIKMLVVGMLIIGFDQPSAHANFTHQSFFSTRSQSVDAARELTGWQRLINRDATDRFYGALYVAPVYTRSYNACQIADYLFDGGTIAFSGSQYPFREPTDILADYFGLPTDYHSIVCFDPVITNFIMDFDFYFGLDSLCNGLYLRVFAPVAHAKWDLNAKEFMPNGAGKNFYPAGYMGPKRVERVDLEDSAIDAMAGLIPFGDKKQPMEYGTMFGRQVVTRVADLRLALGWNYTGERYHAGVQVRTAFPTGNTPTAEYLFEAIAGNGGHWELGGGVTAHYDLWRDADQRNIIALYFDANITHLFKAGQKRSFDFKKNGAGSRYVLLEQFRQGSDNLFVGGPGIVPASNQYRNILVPAINETTLHAQFSFDVQADLVLKLAYYHKGFNLDLGYNFWARSKEKIHSRCRFTSNLYAIKGDAQIYGFDNANNPVALSASESNATLTAGQGAGNKNYANANVNAPVIAANGSQNLLNLNAADSMDLGVTQLDVRTSNPGVLLQDSDLDICASLVPAALTHKMFLYLGNTWNNDEECKWQPLLGFGADVEWRASGKCNSAYSQWGLWMKGGVGF